MTRTHRLRRFAWSWVALIAACVAGGPATAQSAATSAPAASTSVLGAWKIVQARTEPILDQRNARLDLGADGRLSGHTSCNTMSAPYALDGSRIRIGAIITSRMTCPPLKLEQEDRILTALESAVTAVVRGDGLLEIRDSDGRGLLRAIRFEAAAEPQPPGAWPVAGRQGIIQIVIVPSDRARERAAYDREIALICQPDQSCFINFYTNSSNAPVGLPLPEAISNEATAIFRRSVKQAGEFFRWSCRLELTESDCF
ncbi:MAG: META domain-containing protein [Burkholderiaceae bacterium]|nr:META domain-containing protein [Burkholderiaceae bacterium]